MLSLKFKTLTAMVAEEQFTIESLHEATGINKTTLRSIVEREQSRLQKISSQVTGRPGGQPVVYTLRPEARQALEKELEATRSALNSDAEPIPGEETLEAIAKRRIPSELLAAEYLLRERLSEVDDRDQAAIVRQIEKNFSAAEKAITKRPLDDPARNEVLSRLQTAQIQLSLETLRPYLSPTVPGSRRRASTVLVGSINKLAATFAAQLSGALAGTLNDFQISVQLAPPEELAGLLPSHVRHAPNVVIFAVDSAQQSKVPQLRTLLQKSEGKAIVLVVDTATSVGLAGESKACFARYVPNASGISTSWLLREIRYAHAEMEGRLALQQTPVAKYMTAGS